MSEKLISADVIKAKLNNSMKNNATMWNDAYNEGLYQAEKIIDFAPAVDAVEVVRCFQCKHLKELNEHKIFAMCKKTKIAFWSFETDTRTHFCAFGERREDNAVD